MNKLNRTVVLLGSTGYTGGIIAELLDSRGVQFMAYGRSSEKLQIIKKTHRNCMGIRLFNVGDDDLFSILTPNHLVVNCIGPFNVYGREIVAACVNAGACYIDITGEQLVVQESFEIYAEKAKATGAIVIHSMAFESALSDLLFLKSSSITPLPTYRSFNTYYLLNSKQMSPGTRITMKIAKAFETKTLFNGELIPLGTLPDLKNTDPIEPMLGIKVGYPEPVLAKAHGSVKQADAHYLMEKNSDMGLLMTAPPSHNPKLDVEGLIDRHKHNPMKGPTLEERKNQTFEIQTYLTSEDQTIKCVLSGRDMYGLTAELVVFSVMKILNQSNSHIEVDESKGVLTPAQFLKSDGLDWLQTHEQLKLSVSIMNQLVL